MADDLLNCGLDGEAQAQRCCDISLPLEDGSEMDALPHYHAYADTIAVRTARNGRILPMDWIIVACMIACLSAVSSGK